MGPLSSHFSYFWGRRSTSTVPKQNIACVRHIFSFCSVFFWFSPFCRRSPAATTQPPITRVCLPGKMLREALLCVWLLKLQVWLELFLAPRFLTLHSVSSVPSLRSCLRDGFHFSFFFTVSVFSFGTAIPDCFVIGLISLGQTQYSWALVCACSPALGVVH